MITIHKYELDPSNTRVSMPIGATVLTAAFQGNTLCLWAKVDTDNALEIRDFYVYGTGHVISQKVDSSYNFIGTSFMSNGLVFHVFERQS